MGIMLGSCDTFGLVYGVVVFFSSVDLRFGSAF
jgi:hypothetical protein